MGIFHSSIFVKYCGKRSEDGRFGTVDPSPTMGAQQNAFNRSPFAVPDKIFGLTLILDFIDRCTHCAFPASATGSGKARGRGEIFSQKKEQSKA